MKQDKYALDTQLSNRQLDVNGFLHVRNCNLTKECVNPYLGKEIPDWEVLHLKPETIYYGYRKGAELQKAVNTFNGISLMDEHIIDGAEVPQIEHRCGSIGTEARWEAPYIKNTLTINKQEEIDKVESGEKKELSSAYSYKPIFKSGTFEGQNYDFEMTDIKANHVALVSEGRAGSDVVVADSNINIINNKQKLTMKKTLKSNLAMDEEIIIKLGTKEMPLNALINKEFNEQKHQEDIIKDKDLAKGKLFDELNDFLKSKGLSEEDITFIMDKMESHKSEANTTVDEETGKIPSTENTKVDELKTREEPNQLITENENKGAKTAMDSAIATGRTQAVDYFKSISEAGKNVKNLIGEIDLFAFDSAEDIYKLAIKETGLNPDHYKKEAYKGIVDVLNIQNANKINSEYAMDSATANEAEYLTKAKNFKRG